MSVTTTRRLDAMLRVDKLREANWRMDLPGGWWVQLRDPEKVTEAQRRAFKETGVTAKMIGERINDAIASGNYDAAEVLGTRQAAAIVRSDYVAVAMFIESWSFDIPVPTPHDPESLGRLDGVVFDRLNKVAEDLMHGAFFDASVSSEAGSPFENSSD